MKNLSCKTLIHCMAMKQDYELRKFSEEAFSSITNEKVTEHVKDFLSSKDNAKRKADIDSIIVNLYDEKEDKMEVLNQVVQTLKEMMHSTLKLLTETDIMEMYHSGNDLLIKKSKEYIVTKYGHYVMELIHRQFPTYSKFYMDELYNCGIIGLLKAMPKFNPDCGTKFITYCKLFVLHEISEQINFHNNDSTVHYNNVQKTIKNAISQLQDEGMEPNIQKISILTDLKPEIVKRELEYLERVKFCYIDADEEERREEKSSLNSSPEQMYAQKERMEVLLSSINDLSDIIRKIIVRKYELRETNEKIARDLHITIGKVKNCEQKGLRILRLDKRLSETFPEYTSPADKKMEEYKLDTLPQTKDIDEQIDDLLDIMNTL